MVLRFVLQRYVFFLFFRTTSLVRTYTAPVGLGVFLRIVSLLLPHTAPVGLVRG